MGLVHLEAKKLSLGISRGLAEYMGTNATTRRERRPVEQHASHRAFYWLSADGDLCTYSISHRDGMGTVRLGSQLRHAQSPPRHIGLFGSHRV